MVRLTKLLVCGPKKVGKTAYLMRLSKDVFLPDYIPTVEDRFVVQVDTERGTKETFVFIDTAGVTSANAEVVNGKYYLATVDAVVFMYSIDDIESFNRMDLLKRDIEKQLKEMKRDLPIIVIGNKLDLSDKRSIEVDFANNWALREKAKLIEISVLEKKSYLDPLVYVASRIYPGQREGKFTLTKRIKEKQQQGAAIMMDI